MTIRILQGDCREILRTLAPASVHCCVTSPPFYGLRDYGIPPTVWGGDPACPHEWGEDIVENATNHTGKARWQHTRNGRDEEQPIEKRVAWRRTDVRQGAFCRLCEAWAGTLGLEPDYRAYIEHIVEVFREVRRVLRPDGVLWLNMGDSYCSATGAAQRGGPPSDKSTLQGNGHYGGGPKLKALPSIGGRTREAASRGTEVPTVNGRGDPQRSHRGTHAAGQSGKQGYRIDASEPAVAPNRTAQPDLKAKDLMGMPWAVAFALRDDGWWLRAALPWLKANPMPESCVDRPGSGVEYFFLLASSERYFYDHIGVRRAMMQASLDRLTQPGIFDQPGGPKDSKTGNRSHRRALNNQAERLIKHEKWKSRQEDSEDYDKSTGRNFRNTDLFFDSLQRPYGLISDTDGDPLAIDRPTEPTSDAHFATFGAGLITPLIRAATSERGCCTKCGASWHRIAEEELVPTAKAAKTFIIDARDHKADANDQGSNRQKDGHRPGWIKNATTIGWSPTCKCGGDVRPCTVLDPFAGAGTVGLAADRLQRDAVLIEIGEAYVEMARRRIARDAPLFSQPQTGGAAP